jgi:beta-glucan synthesis-associated protein KRE6
MILYKIAGDENGVLVPPRISRNSVLSTSGDSIVSLSLNSDSKYPSGITNHQGGLVPYIYDPADDLNEPLDEEDLLHDPSNKEPTTGLALRGFLNVGVLVILTGGLLCLFVFYPVLSFLRDNARNLAIDGNININATGQSSAL